MSSGMTSYALARCPCPPVRPALLQIRYSRSVDIRRAAAQRAFAGLLEPPRRAGGGEAMGSPPRRATKLRRRLLTATVVTAARGVPVRHRLPDMGGSY